MRYEVQHIEAGYDASGRENWRVTDTKSDSRIATCYDKQNADFIVRILNRAPDEPSLSPVSRTSDILAMTSEEDDETSLAEVFSTRSFTMGDLRAEIGFALRGDSAEGEGA